MLRSASAFSSLVYSFLVLAVLVVCLDSPTPALSISVASEFDLGAHNLFSKSEIPPTTTFFPASLSNYSCPTNCSGHIKACQDDGLCYCPAANPLLWGTHCEHSNAAAEYLSRILVSIYIAFLVLVTSWWHFRKERASAAPVCQLPYSPSIPPLIALIIHR